MGYLPAGIWVIASGVITYGLYVGADIFAPFALAVFLWLVIEGFARLMQERIPKLPRWLAQTSAVLIVLGIALTVTLIFIDGLNDFAKNAGAYEARINEILTEIYARFNIFTVAPPDLSRMLFNEENTKFVQPILDSVQGLASSFVLIMIYIAFLFLAEKNWPTKLDNIFPDTKTRSQAREVGHQVRKSMEEYLWVQTVISGIITVITYVTLLILGLDNALFWAFIVFFLNYIPTIGSIVAAFLPGLFALAQPEWPAYMPTDATLNALIVLASVSIWQFAIGNFVQPRMMGESLNLSALVVLVSLAIWGALWGIPGMFLSAPLTVLMMILFAQIPGAHWLAILLSADGHPVKNKPIAAKDDSENASSA